MTTYRYVPEIIRSARFENSFLMYTSGRVNNEIITMTILSTTTADTCAHFKNSI